MRMYVHTNANQPSGTSIDLSTVPLIAGDTYYVDCVVEDAVPEPTITVGLTGATFTLLNDENTQLQDVTSGSLANRRKTLSWSFVALQPQCDEQLSCMAFNDANTLLRSNNPTLDAVESISSQVQVIGKVFFKGILYDLSRGGGRKR